jgi:hypothetical protein
MSIITNLETEILIEPIESFVQSNSNIVHNGTITIDNRGNSSQDPVFTIEINNALTSFVITNVTTGISATVPSTTISAGISLLVYADAIYKNSTSTEISATFTGVLNLKENVVNTISFGLTPSAATSINVDTTWLKPNGNAAIQGFVEGFSITENISLRPNTVNRLNKYNSGYSDEIIDYDFSMDRLRFDNQLIDIDRSKKYLITYRTDSNIGAILPSVYYLTDCKFNSYNVSQASTQQVDAIKEGIRGKGCRLLKG